MPAAPAFVSSPQSRAIPVAALVLSVLVHVGAALLWLSPRLALPPDEPAAMAVDLVPPQPEPEPPQPEPVAEPEPDPDPLPPPDQGDGRPADAAPEIIPQLDPGLLAPRPAPARIAPVPKAPPTRSERDLVLAQVVRHWKPPPELKAFVDAEFAVKVTVLANGTLAAPFAARAPYDPAAAIEGYGALHPQDPQRRASETFYRALRQAQPLRLPAALAAKAPFEVVLNFRVRDVR